MGNAFVHVELHTDDVSGARSFYSKLFDWKMEEMEMGPMTYTMLNMGENETTGGITQKMCPDAPSHWLAYALVDDVAATCKKAAGLGATIVVEKKEIPKMGFFSVLQDPTGAVFAIWQSAKS